MGILSSLFAGVSGLNANGTALSVMSSSNRLKILLMLANDFLSFSETAARILLALMP